MVRHFRVCFFTLLFVFTSAHAATPNSSLEAPLITGPKVSLPSPSQSKILRVTVWNVQKGHHSRFQKEFTHLSENSDLMLLQEVLLHKEKRKALAARRDATWVMAEAWRRNGVPTGTAILSAFQFFFSFGLLSPDSEPIANTPKSSVSFVMPIKGQTQPLLVVNTHAINFTRNWAYTRHMQSVSRFISSHEGPVLWAGDFNTWRSSRWKILHDEVKILGLSAVSFKKDPRNLVLDHVFVRGLKVSGAQVLNRFRSSDHWPIYFFAQPRQRVSETINPL